MTTDSSARSASCTGAAHLLEGDLLSSCVHCGLCLEVCPTYQLSGDENNSPRGRLRLWRREAEGQLPPDEWTDHYTSECVGCLACESACPANVPYGEILEHVRRDHCEAGRASPRRLVRLAASLAANPNWMSWLMLPARLLRRWGIAPHRLVFSGAPAVFESTASYARRLVQQHQPDGPRVALLSGCLMEALFREVNFATVRVLVENNVQVVVPEEQRCCGAFQEHSGLAGVEQLREANRRAFGELEVDAVVSNSSGCGHSLQKALDGEPVVRDVLDFLGGLDLIKRTANDKRRVYVDLPCHLVHGQKVAGIPASVLDAMGREWSWAPKAYDCCGSGGSYNLDKPENARQILDRKTAFLRDAETPRDAILATSNHVCMMQWDSARKLGLAPRSVEVRHVIQLLDPGDGFVRAN